jgi:hypothetical protein
MVYLPRAFLSARALAKSNTGIFSLSRNGSSFGEQGDPAGAVTHRIVDRESLLLVLRQPSSGSVNWKARAKGQPMRMMKEAAAAGFCEPRFFPGEKVARVQILTIDELLSKMKVAYPRVAPDETFKRAAKTRKDE